MNNEYALHCILKKSLLKDPEQINGDISTGIEDLKDGICHNSQEIRKYTNLKTSFNYTKLLYYNVCFFTNKHSFSNLDDPCMTSK